MRMLRDTLVIGTLTMFLAVVGSTNQGPSRDVSAKEAEELVRNAMSTHPVPPSLIGLDPLKNPNFPDFYFFEAQWDNPNGSPIAGHFAVDPKTGDVWDAAVCREYVSTDLRKLQRTIRKKISLSETQYHKLRRPGPMCSPGETPLRK